MCDEPYIIIHTGDPYEFVIKNVNEPETYGTFHGDKYDQKSMKKFIEKVNRIVKENEQLKQSYIQLEHRHSLLHDECLDAECDRDSYHKDVLSLEKENEQLKAQLYCDSNEGVCIICKHHYLEKGNIFYISKCEKRHEKCSKESVRHCEDFEVKELEND